MDRNGDENRDTQKTASRELSAVTPQRPQPDCTPSKGVWKHGASSLGCHPVPHSVSLPRLSPFDLLANTLKTLRKSQVGIFFVNTATNKTAPF